MICIAVKEERMFNFLSLWRFCICAKRYQEILKFLGNSFFLVRFASKLHLRKTRSTRIHFIETSTSEMVAHLSVKIPPIYAKHLWNRSMLPNPLQLYTDKKSWTHIWFNLGEVKDDGRRRGGSQSRFWWLRGERGEDNYDDRWWHLSFFHTAV